MRHLFKRIYAAVAIWILIFPSAHAENFLETIFGGMSRQRVKPVIGRRAGPPRWRVASLPVAGSPMTLTVHRHVVSKGHARAQFGKSLQARAHHKQKTHDGHKSDGRPVLSENEKYLASASFSQRFSCSRETALTETQDAVNYLIEHDETLRRGDALVTQSGVIVFDPHKAEYGAFVATNDKHVSKALKKRLVSVVEPGVQRGSLLSELEFKSAKYPGRGDSAVKSEAAAEPNVHTADGRTIRFVGGYSPQEGQLPSAREDAKLRVTAISVRN